MEEFNIIVENSAPSQSKSSRILQWACDEVCKGDSKKFDVADFGCGRLRNLPLLNKYFKQVVLVDTKLQCERIMQGNLNYGCNALMDFDAFHKYEMKFDIISLICVLHIIPTIDERELIIKTIHSKLKKHGLLVVDVPQGENYYRSKMTSESRYSDGYVLGKGTKRTFYKNYYANELDNFIMQGSRFKIYKKKYFDKHLVRIYEKEG